MIWIRLQDISLKAFSMTTTQVSIAGHFSGNDGDNNIYGSTINNYSVPLHSYVPSKRPFITGFYVEPMAKSLCRNL